MLNKKILSLMFLIFIANIYALQQDMTKPVQIVADHALLDEKNKSTVFSGNIVITRGSLVIHAATGTASQDLNGDRILDLYGSPVVFQQLTDDGKEVIGQCNHFNYDTKTALAILTDRARVKKGKSIIIGDKLTYNTKTEVYTALSTRKNGITHQSSGRVTVILDQNDMNAPKSDESKPQPLKVESGIKKK